MLTSLFQTNTKDSFVRTTQNVDLTILSNDHAGFLFRFAMARVRDESIAEDLVQETLLAALKNGNKFAGKSSERTWLTAILKNKINDHFRKTNREQPFDELSDEDFFQADGSWKPEFSPRQWNANPVQMVENQELWQVVNRCLSSLPPRTSAAFVLREIEGLDSAEICRVLDISPNNLWVLLHRARMRLRHDIEINLFGDGIIN